MSTAVRSLTVIQQWDCQSCSACCRTYQVRVTPAEAERIRQQNWPLEMFTEAGGAPIETDLKTGEMMLNHTTAGACVFLGPENLCQ
ncbi:MAG: YkgJ family cysteine cluster protein, partial [Gemmataceae bacterium]